MSARAIARTLVLGLAALALLVGACGGSPEDDVREVVTAADENIADGEKFCSDYLTEEFVTRSFGDIEACERAAKEEEPARGFEVGEVKVDGDRATAMTKDEVTGDSVVELVKDDGEWRINNIR